MQSRDGTSHIAVGKGFLAGHYPLNCMAHLHDFKETKRVENRQVLCRVRDKV
jgi:hypothetical protein